MVCHSIQEIILFLLFIKNIDVATGNSSSSMQDVENDTKIKLCKGRNCPNFTLNNDFSNRSDATHMIHYRQYYSGKYIASKGSNCDYSKSLHKGYMKLAAYRGGQNSANKAFNMTLPVLAKVDNVQQCRQSHTIFFYLPYDMQENSPRPIDNNKVKIVNFPTMHLYTYSFHETNLSQGVEKYDEFKAILDAKGLCFKPNVYYIAHYGPYHSPGQKISEIWVKKTNC